LQFAGPEPVHEVGELGKKIGQEPDRQPDQNRRDRVSGPVLPEVFQDGGEGGHGVRIDDVTQYVKIK
jgi:hypothetical protein